jgi:hypothetical protein
MRKIAALFFLPLCLMCCTGTRNALLTIGLKNPQIAGYYSDYNYIVEHSTDLERLDMIATLRGRAASTPPSSDTHTSTLMNKLKSVLGAEDTTDPGMIRLMDGRVDFWYEIEPLELVQVAKDHIVVKTRRTALNHIVLGRPAERSSPNGRGFTAATPGSSFIEFHDWVLDNGTWRISDIRIDPVES